jgi:hypothetical protein
VVAVQAQENATLVLRSGEKITGQLVDYGGVGFTVRVSGQERQISPNDVAVVDFTGGGDVSDADWSKAGGGPTVFLRNGQTVSGQLYDIAGTQPLRITFKTSGGDREFSSAEIARIVFARPSASGNSGGSSTLGVPEGAGIAVSGTQAWTPTGLTVRRGEQLVINATGEVRLSADASDAASPTGSRAGRTSANAPLPQVPVGALIARVGNSAPFPLGDNLKVTMPANGQLFLGINDDHTGDNQGGFRVNIDRGTRSR